jgi:hypothetical protein
MATLTLLIVAGVAAGGWWLLQQDAAEPDRAQVAPRQRSVDPPRTPPTPGNDAPLDGDFYVHVKLIELAASPGGDGSWDVRGGAPDVVFRLAWNGTDIFTSPHRDDTLVAEFDLLRLDLMDALQSGEVEIATAIAAPLVAIDPEGLLTIEIWDDDDWSGSDEAGRFDLPASTLRPGINRLDFSEGDVRRVVIDMIPRSLSLPELLARASDR